MRQFSQQEKEWTKQIVKCDQIGEFIGNLLDKELEKASAGIYYNREENRVDIRFSRTLASNSNAVILIENATNIQRAILLLVSLLQYLSKQGLLLIFQFVNEEEKECEFGCRFDGEPFISQSINDLNVKLELLEYIDRQLVPTEELKALVKRNFMSEEDIRFEEQKKHNRKTLATTWIAIVAAFIIGVLPLTLDTCQPPTAGLEKLLKEQCEEIRKIHLELKSLKQSQPNADRFHGKYLNRGQHRRYR